MPRSAPAQVNDQHLLPAGGAAPIRVGSAGWRAWLTHEHTTSFVYHGAAGRFTARRERQRNGWYWYAYRRVGGRLHKRYLGRAADLDAERLQLIAAEFTALSTSHLLQEHPASQAHDVRSATLTARLRPPLPRPALVARPHLVARLDTALDAPLTLVSAPPGFGKSTLLAAWAANQAAPTLASGTTTVAWISLDRLDDELTRFWGTIAAALDMARPGLGAGALALLESPQIPPPQRLLEVVLRDLSTVPGRAIIVLDDYHLIEAAPVHESVAMFVDHLPAHVHLALATRSDPPLPLARWRVRGCLAELRAADLRFTTSEVAAFLRSTMGLDLPVETVHALEERTEGWAAALQLAALSIRDRADAATFIDRFAGSHRAVVDYLAEEVINRQSPEVQTFLLRTSVLERLSAPLCAAVLEPAHDTVAAASPASQLMLDHLERANLFVIPLDEERRWYRYHHMFAEMLRDRLQRTQPALVAELHCRAARWYRAARFDADAISHLLSAGDHAGAADVIAGVAEETLWEHGDARTLLRWIAALPESIILADVRLALIRIWALLASIQFDAAEERAAELEQALSRYTSQDRDTMIGELAAIRSIAARVQGYVSRAIELAGIALDRLPSGDPTIAHTIAAMNLIDAYSMQGDLLHAEQAAAELRPAPSARSLIIPLIGMLSRAGLRRDQGRLAEALAIAEETLRLTEQRGASGRPLTAMIHLALADICYEQDHLDEAERYAQLALRHAERWWNNDILGNSLGLLAAVRRARGDLAAAEEIFERVERLHLDYHVGWITNQVQAGRAQRLLHTGDRRAAERWAESCGLSLDDAPPPERFHEYLTLARVALARDRSLAVLPLLDRLATHVERGQHTTRLIEVLKLRALAYRQAGNTTGSRQALARALLLAEPGAMIRTFVDEGEPMKWLLADCSAWIEPQAQQGDPTARRLLAHTDRVMAAFRRAPPGDPGAPGVRAAGMAETPTMREIQVLRLLAAGHTDRDIAATLVISVSTVRSHTRRIYAKLGVHNRLQAVARARELDLVG